MIHIALSLLAQIPDPGTNPDGFLSLLFKAITSKQYWLLASLAVIGLTWLAQKLLAGRVPFLATDKGQTLTHFVLAFAGVFATAAAAGQPITLGLALTAFGVALAAVGGLEALSRLFFGAQQVAAAQAAGAQAAGAVTDKATALGALPK